MSQGTSHRARNRMKNYWTTDTTASDAETPLDDPVPMDDRRDTTGPNHNISASRGLYDAEHLIDCQQEEDDKPPPLTPPDNTNRQQRYPKIKDKIQRNAQHQIGRKKKRF